MDKYKKIQTPPFLLSFFSIVYFWTLLMRVLWTLSYEWEVFVWKLDYVIWKSWKNNRETIVLFMCPFSRIIAELLMSSKFRNYFRFGHQMLQFHFYILSETRMLRNHYFSVFLSDQICYLLPILLLIVGVVFQLVFNRFIEFSHLGVNNTHSWLI